MARELPQWVGKTDSTPVPPRVRARVFMRDGGRCQCGCRVLIRPGDKWQTDHIIAIINGGKNDESNLQTLLIEHHKAKTEQDVAEKAKTARVQLKHLGIKPSRTKIQSRDFQRAAPQRSASRPIERRT